MPWRRGHYYRSVRVNGRPKHVHIGTGPMAQLIAQQDDAAWEARRAAELAEDLRRARADAVDQLVEEADSHLDALPRAAYWQKRLGAAHRRHLSAVKALAAIRKLAVPVRIGQVNIATRQVNQVEVRAATGGDEREGAGTASRGIE